MGQIDTVDKIRNILKHDKDMKLTFGKYDDIKWVVEFIVKQIDIMQADGEPRVAPDEWKRVVGVVDGLLHRTIHDPHTKILKDLTFYMVKLISNWNNNVANNGDLKLKLAAIDRMMKDATTMSDANFMLRELTKSIKGWVRYRPPMFDVSRHYLKTLQEEQ